jgi:hypothetical protein
MDYWLQYFTMDELNELKNKIHNNDMIQLFSNHIQTIKFTENINYTKDKYSDNKIEKNINEYKRISFIILLLIGIITNRIKNDKINIIVKGGRAIQFLLNNTSQPYVSDDIDIIINDNVSKDNKILSYQLITLIYWILDQTINHYDNILSFIENEHVIKLSHKVMYNSSTIYTALLDINFIDNKFTYYKITSFFDPIFGILEYKHQTLNNMLHEKLYYVSFYKFELESYTMDMYYYNHLIRIINKFKIQINILISFESKKNRNKKELLNRIIIENNIYDNNLISFIMN